jgi:hypothetical protein
MRTAAKLDPNGALWRTGEVRGHDVRRPAIEGKRRSGHAAVADRYELWHPLRALLLEQGDGILPIGSWRPGGVARAGCMRPETLTYRGALGGRNISGCRCPSGRSARPSGRVAASRRHETVDKSPELRRAVQPVPAVNRHPSHPGLQARRLDPGAQQGRLAAPGRRAHQRHPPSGVDRRSNRASRRTSLCVAPSGCGVARRVSRPPSIGLAMSHRVRAPREASHKRGAVAVRRNPRTEPPTRVVPEGARAEMMRHAVEAQHIPRCAGPSGASAALPSATPAAGFRVVGPALGQAFDKRCAGKISLLVPCAASDCALWLPVTMRLPR